MSHRRSIGSFLLTLCVVFSAALPLTLIPSSSFAAAPALEYRLKQSTKSPNSLDVTITFDITSGQQVFLKKYDPGFTDWEPQVEPSIEFSSSDDSAYSLESLPDGSGWMVTGLSGGKADLSYSVRFAAGSPPLARENAPEGAGCPRYLFGDGLTVFRAYDALLGVLAAPGSKAMASSCTVRISPPRGQRALVPWEPTTGNGAYEVSGQDALFQQFVSWGRMDLETLRDDKPAITVGFVSGFDSDEKVRRVYSDGLLKMYEEFEGVMGPRAQAPIVTVLAAPGSPYGLRTPTGDTLFTSVALFTGSAMAGATCSTAGRGLFQLWNAWTMKPKSGGDAGWFQAGLPWFYPYRVAARVGLLAGGDAYSSFSKVYAGYLENPVADSQSLAEAEGEGNAALLRDKGATLAAAIAMKLPGEGKGAARDIDWLVGQVAARYKALDGKRYTLADISEILETSTGKSWDAYFSDRVRSGDLIGADQFSSTKVFVVSTTVASSGGAGGSGSSYAWAYLLAAVVVILCIPLVFSAYVRRSVKMDLTMPRIIPDDDDEDA